MATMVGDMFQVKSSRLHHPLIGGAAVGLHQHDSHRRSWDRDAPPQLNHNNHNNNANTSTNFPYHHRNQAGASASASANANANTASSSKSRAPESLAQHIQPPLPLAPAIARAGDPESASQPDTEAAGIFANSSATSAGAAASLAATTARALAASVPALAAAAPRQAQPRQAHKGAGWETREAAAPESAGAPAALSANHIPRAIVIPTPPSSASSHASKSGGARPQHGISDPTHMEPSSARDLAAAASLGSAPAPAHLAALSASAPPSSGYSSTSSTSSASSAATAATVVQIPPSSIPSLPEPGTGYPPTSLADAAHVHAADAVPTTVDPSSPTADSTAGYQPQHTHPSPSPAPFAASASLPQTTIHVHDLAHIQSLARDDLQGSASGEPGILNDPPLQQMKYEISGMPIGDIIEMVAALLTKITTTNDLQHDALNRNALHVKQAQAHAGDDLSQDACMNQTGSSVLAFHGKNVPAITILSYLSRIHKYCPTTYEVFLSLLVYFDRMTERVNNQIVQADEAHRTRQADPDVNPIKPHQSYQQRRDSGNTTVSATSSSAERPIPPPPQQRGEGVDTVMRHGDDSHEDADSACVNGGHSDGAVETDSELADSDDPEDDDANSGGDLGGKHGAWSRGASSDARTHAPGETGKRSSPSVGPRRGSTHPATYFVVDSFNIHRLIIAGVTCASKFFSDVFYTNSRYAKVGGLPLPELNHLELQFLLLNDFRLAVPVEDLEAYATMLVEFYAREVLSSTD